MFIQIDFSGDDASPEGSPRAPPRRQERTSRGKSPGAGTSNSMVGPNSQNRPVSNGLPPTPKVHMGACFSKVPPYNFFTKEPFSHLLTEQKKS